MKPDDSRIGTAVPKGPLDRGRFFAAGLCLLSLAVGVLVLALFGPIPVDDGYYYLGIASNLAEGRGFSFDGINPTNGFHPLWQLLLVPVMAVSGGGVPALWLASLVQLVLFAAGGLALFATAGRLDPPVRWAAPAVSALWLANLWLLTKGGMSCMETGLAVLLHGMSLLSLVEYLSRGRSPVRASLLLALLVASRLDTILLVLLVGLAILIFTRRLRDSVLLVAPAGLFTVLYASVNLLTTGRLAPVSAFVKSEPGRMMLRRLFGTGNMALIGHGVTNALEFLTLGGRLSPIILLCGVLILGALAVLGLRRSGRALRVLTLSHLAYSIGLLVFYSLAYGSLLDTYTYYWFPVILGWILLLPALFWTAGGAWAARVVLVLMLALTLGFDLIYGADLLGSYAFRIPMDSRPETAGIRFLDALPDGSLIASWDAGFLGYFCRHPVVNLDGLVNSYDYLDAIRTSGLGHYLDSAGVTHIANLDYYLEKREMIEAFGGWDLVFEESDTVGSQTTRFTLSPTTRGYCSEGIRTFYVYGRQESR
ncbi:hypothetical protein JW921_03665 [Candidatus Fermentibacterales bacterium]|nr:hypothetical protein [Candidatus Fermentibacterales bacterium]